MALLYDRINHLVNTPDVMRSVLHAGNIFVNMWKDTHGKPVIIGEFCDLMRVAQIYDFGDLHLEPGERDDNHDLRGVQVPELTAVEKEFWKEGLLPMPAPVCWFETVINGLRSGFLIKEHTNGPAVQRVEFNKTGLLISGCWVHAFTSSKLPGQAMATTHYHSVGPHKYSLQFVRRFYDLETDELTAVGLSGAYSLMQYLCLMLNSRSSELRKVLPPEKLNKARVKSGKLPLRKHTIVTIVPTRFRREMPQRERKPGEPMWRMPLHWKSSHLRHFDHATDNSRFVERCICCGRENVYVTLIPRFLVGKREFGEVTHEYRVKHGAVPASRRG